MMNQTNINNAVIEEPYEEIVENSNFTNKNERFIWTKYRDKTKQEILISRTFSFKELEQLYREQQQALKDMKILVKVKRIEHPLVGDIEKKFLVKMPVILDKGDWIDLSAAETIKLTAPQSGTIKYKNADGKKQGYYNVAFNGITYIPVLNTKDILVNQFIDFQEFIKEPDAHIANLAAIFFIRKGCKYGDRDPIEEAKFLGEHLSITDYKDVFNFFLKAWRQYTNNTQASLMSNLRKTLKKTKDKTIRIKILRTMINLKQIHLLASLI